MLLAVLSAMFLLCGFLLCKILSVDVNKLEYTAGLHSLLMSFIYIQDKWLETKPFQRCVNDCEIK